MLHIVCANTSIDSRLEVDRFSIGDVIRAKKTSSFLSGKGVNSAFCINFLREECVVHCICGEFDKDLFSMHGLSNVKFEIVTAPDETRRNITIISNQDLIVHIQAQGFVVNDHMQKYLPISSKIVSEKKTLSLFREVIQKDLGAITLRKYCVNHLKSREKL